MINIVWRGEEKSTMVILYWLVYDHRKRYGYYKRRSDYGILREHDKQLYAAVKEAMDQIHSELGHGKNHWALAMRYMGDI